MVDRPTNFTEMIPIKCHYYIALVRTYITLWTKKVADRLILDEENIKAEYKTRLTLTFERQNGDQFYRKQERGATWKWTKRIVKWKRRYNKVSYLFKLRMKLSGKYEDTKNAKNETNAQGNYKYKN